MLAIVGSLPMFAAALMLFAGRHLEAGVCLLLIAGAFKMFGLWVIFSHARSPIGRIEREPLSRGFPVLPPRPRRL